MSAQPVTPASLARRQSRLLADVKLLADTPNFARLAEAEAAAAAFEEELEKIQQQASPSEISDHRHSSESFEPVSSPDQRPAVSEEEFPEISDSSSPASPPVGDAREWAPVRPAFRLDVAQDETHLEISSPTRRTTTAQTARQFSVDRETGPSSEISRRGNLEVFKWKMEISKMPPSKPPQSKAEILRSLNEHRRTKFWTSMDYFHKAAISIIAAGERMGNTSCQSLAIYRPRKDFLFVPRKPKRPKVSLLQLTSVALIQRAFRDHLQRMRSRKSLEAFSTLPDSRARARARSARKQTEISS